MEDSFVKFAVRLLKECEKSLEDHFRGGPRPKVAGGSAQVLRPQSEHQVT